MIDDYGRGFHLFYEGEYAQKTLVTHRLLPG